MAAINTHLLANAEHFHSVNPLAVLEDDSTLSVNSSQLWKHTDVVESFSDTILFLKKLLDSWHDAIEIVL